MSIELRTLRDGARRPIPWELLTDVDARLAAPVGREWRERMRQEHLAVGAFSMLATELAEDGCDPAVLWLLTRAAADEVRHADVCARVATGLLGEAEVSARLRGLPRIPAHRDASASDRALLHVVEMCCLSETVTGVWFTEAIARASHPTMRAVLESLLEDEIDHGRVGWALLAARAREGRASAVSPALPEMLERVFGGAFERRLGEDGGEAIEALGSLSRRTGRAVLARALREVILPGFETLGVDLGAARARIAERGWLR